jgi:hypothetical protein
MAKTLTLVIDGQPTELSLHEVKTLQATFDSLLGTGPGQEPFLIDKQLYDPQVQPDQWKVLFEKDGVIVSNEHDNDSDEAQ